LIEDTKSSLLKPSLFFGNLLLKSFVIITKASNLNTYRFVLENRVVYSIK